MSRPKWHRVFMAIALAGAGVIAGASISNMNVAHGEQTPGVPPRSFETGGQQSVPILREIAATLHQMDARLSRLEIVAQKLRSTPTRRAVTEDAGDAGSTN